MQVRFRAGDLTIRAEVLNESSIESQHTGRNLFEIKVEFRADEAHHQEITAARGASGTFLLRDGEPAEEIPITIQQQSHSFTVGRREQVYKWVLTEQEELTLETLELGDVSLRPYKFEEEVQNGMILINARVEIDPATREKISALPHYFSVVRKGISDQPVSMRFGQALWSQTESENTKHRYVLVEERYDSDNKNQGFLQPQFGNMRDLLAVTSVQLSRLLRLLEDKSLLTRDEIASVIDVPKDELRTEHRSLNQVIDIDEWLD